MNSLTQQVSHLKAAEARFAAEREVLYKERNSNSKILANVQQIQLNLERKEEEESLRLRTENAALAQEVCKCCRFGSISIRRIRIHFYS